MVFEIQPKLDWDKGKAVLYLLEALDLDGDNVVPFYFGDDITDEHAFEALAGRASASSSAAPTTRRWAAVPPPTSCSIRPRRWSNFWTSWHGNRG